MAMAGPDFYRGQYEFQCLHGMGEPLYEEVVGPAKLDRPCRVYAPVGTHETLLAYLVRRLLENGANTSFVNRDRRPERAGRRAGRRSGRRRAGDRRRSARRIREIALPRDLYGRRGRTRAGLDLSNESALAALAAALPRARARRPRRLRPRRQPSAGAASRSRNPADRRDVVGQVRDATPARDRGARWPRAARRRAGLGGDARPTSAPPACAAPPTLMEARDAAC